MIFEISIIAVIVLVVTIIGVILYLRRKKSQPNSESTGSAGSSSIILSSNALPTITSIYTLNNNGMHKISLNQVDGQYSLQNVIGKVWLQQDVDMIPIYSYDLKNVESSNSSYNPYTNCMTIWNAVTLNLSNPDSNFSGVFISNQILFYAYKDYTSGLVPLYVACRVDNPDFICATSPADIPSDYISLNTDTHPLCYIKPN